jgi:hypothetical protein
MGGVVDAALTIKGDIHPKVRGMEESMLIC